MKKILFLVGLLACAVSAQLPDSMLTDAQKAYLKAEEVKKQSETAAEAAGAWVGVGRELGVAVNESLAALTDNADKLANTRVGTFTMFAVAWKLFAGDIIKVVAGLILTFILLIFLAYYYTLIFLIRKDDSSEASDSRAMYVVISTSGIVVWVFFGWMLVANIG